MKEVVFFKTGRRVSTKKPDKGLFVGVSGDSEESKSSMAKEKRLPDMVLAASK